MVNQVFDNLVGDLLGNFFNLILMVTKTINFCFFLCSRLFIFHAFNMFQQSQKIECLKNSGAFTEVSESVGLLCIF